MSSNGARAAGRHGIGLLSMAATTPEGSRSLREHWAAYEQSATEHGQVVDRAIWRCVGPVHLAETREQARREVAYGIQRFAHYFTHVVPSGIWDGETVDEILASNDAKGTAIIGTPDDAIERIGALAASSGGFGTFLLMAADWTDPDASASEPRALRPPRHAALQRSSRRIGTIVGVGGQSSRALRERELGSDREGRPRPGHGRRRMTPSEIIRAHYLALNTGDFDHWPALLAESFAVHHASFGTTAGRSAYLTGVRNYRVSFPDVHVELLEVLEQGPTVAARFTSRGTFVADFMGMSATGVRWQLPGMGFYRTDGARLQEAWFVEDVTGWLRDITNGATRG